MATDTVAGRVREARQAVKEKPKDFAKAIGITKSALSQIENNPKAAATIKASTAFAIQDHTGYSARWVALGKGQKKAKTRPEDEISEEILELARKIADLKKEKRDLLMEIFASAVPDEALTADWKRPDRRE